MESGTVQATRWDSRDTCRAWRFAPARLREGSGFRATWRAERCAGVQAGSCKASPAQRRFWQGNPGRRFRSIQKRLSAWYIAAEDLFSGMSGDVRIRLPFGTRGIFRERLECRIYEGAQIPAIDELVGCFAGGVVA